MPVVLNFDDPAIVATLASQASRYAVNQQGFQDALRVQQLNSSRGGDQPARPGMGMEEYGQPVAGATNPNSPSWTETTPTGSTIYHPQGDPQPATNNGSFSNGIGEASANGAMTLQQRQLSNYVDQLDKSGQLQPGEALRMKGQIIGGSNPFDKPTMNQDIALKEAGGGITAAQQGAQDLSKQRLDNTAGNEDYTRRRENLLDQIKTVQAQFGSLNTSVEDRKTLKDELDGLRTTLKNLPSTYNAGGIQSAPKPDATNPPVHGAGVQMTANSNAAGSTSVQSLDTAKAAPTDVQFLLKKYNNNAERARAAYALGERAPASGG